MPKRGKFIVLEGIDGAGTSTQISLLKESFESLGLHQVYATGLPSDSEIGRLIRRYLQGEIPLPRPESFATLFMLDHANHYAQAIEPKLAAGVNVLCDRFDLSTYVYQSQKLSLKWLVHTRIQLGVAIPDLTIILDIDAEESLERISQRKKIREVYEIDLVGLRKIADTYRLFVHPEKRAKIPYLKNATIEIIDGDRPIPEVTKELERLVLSLNLA